MALVCTGNMLKDYESNSHAVTTNSSGTGKSLGYTPYDKGVYNVSNHGNSAIITNARSSSYLELLVLLIYMIGILQVIILH